MTPGLITSTLRDAVRFLGADLGFLPSEVTARSLRASGATALLVANVDPDVIRLLGRWSSSTATLASLSTSLFALQSTMDKRQPLLSLTSPTALSVW